MNKFFTEVIVDHKQSIEDTKTHIDWLEKLDDTLKRTGKSNNFASFSSDAKGAEDDIRKLSNEIAKQEGVLKKAATAEDKLKKSTKELGDEMGKAKDNTEKFGDEVESTGDKAEKSGGKVKGYLGGFNNVVSKLFPLYGQLTDSLDGVIDKNESVVSGSAGFKKGFGTIKTAIAGATKAGLAFIATPIGAAIAVLAGIGAATKKWFDYNNAVLKVNETLEGITGQSGAVLDNIRIRATAIQDVFDVAIDETTKTAQKLVTNFGIDYDRAIDVIEDGLVRGAKANDEFFSSLQEYGVFFEQAGFSVEQFRDVVNAGYDLGIYQDKLPDAIKEFKISVEEQTQGARDALEGAFGKNFTDKLFKGVADGSITIKDALAQVAAEADKVGLNSAQAGTLAADLFRGAGEDAGGVLKVFEAVNIALDQQEKELTEIEQIRQTNIDSATRLGEAQDRAFKSDSFIQFKTQISTGLNEIGIFFLDVFTDIRESAQSVFSVFGIIKDNVFDLLAPIGDLIDYVGEFEIVQRLFNSTGEEGSGILAKVRDVVITMLNPLKAIEVVVKSVGAIFNGTVSVIKDFGEILRTAIEPFANFDFSAPLESIRKFNFSSIKDSGKKLANSFTDGFNEVFDVDIISEVNESVEETEKKTKNTFTNLNKNSVKAKTGVAALNETIKQLKAQLEAQVFAGDLVGAEETGAKIRQLNDLLEEFSEKRNKFLLGAREVFAESGIEVPDIKLDPFDNPAAEESMSEFLKILDDAEVKVSEFPDVEVGVDFKEQLFEDAKQKIANLFDVDKKVIDKLAEGLMEVVDIAVQIGQELYDARLNTLDAEIEAIQEKKAVIEQGLDAEFQAQEDGFANSYDLRVGQLADLQAAEDRAIKERQELQNKAAKAEFIAETASQTLNLISAAAKIYNSLAAIPVIGVVGATAVIAAMFAAFGAAKAKAFQSISLYEGGAISDYLPQDDRNGNVRRSGVIDPIGGGKSDKNGQKGMNVQGTNMYLNGNEFVVRNEVTGQHLEFLKKLNGGLYNGIDFDALIHDQLNPKEHNVFFEDAQRDIDVYKIDAINEDQMRAIMADVIKELKPAKPGPSNLDRSPGSTIVEGDVMTTYL